MAVLVRAAASTVAAASLVLITGCGPRLQKANGKVLVDGVPVKHGTVTFYPVASGRPALATIQPDGTFTLSFSKPGDGLPPGEYKVAIVGDELRDRSRSAAELAQIADLKKKGLDGEIAFMGLGQEVVHIVPPIYNDLQTTPLTQTVTASAEPLHFVFDIATKKK